MTPDSNLSKLVVSGAVLMFGTLALGATPSQIDHRVNAALSRFYAQDPGRRELAGKAAAMLVFPRVTKAGAGVGGSFGEGELKVNGATVGYYKVTSGSLGATLGVARRSEVILFMTDEARDRFMSGHGWTVGADAQVAVVKGAGADVDDETLRQPVLAFVYGEKGLIADASLEGTKVTKLDE